MIKRRALELIIFTLVIITCCLLTGQMVLHRQPEFAKNKCDLVEQVEVNGGSLHPIKSRLAVENKTQSPPRTEDMLEELRTAGYTITLKSLNTHNQSIRLLPGLLNNPSSGGGGVAGRGAHGPPPPPPPRDLLVVPNVVHYVWLGTDLSFNLIQYLSFLSVKRHIRPDYIFVHGEVGPSGPWWDKALQEISNIYHVLGTAPKNAYNGMRLIYPAHESDLFRTELLYKFGGIYLDADVIVLKTFDPLRRFHTTMGRERPDGVCNAIMLCSKGAPFMRLLRDQYESYNTGGAETWALRSVEVPHKLAQIFKSWIHIEEDTLNRPNSYELQLIFDHAHDWSMNYAIHTWVRVRQRNGGLNIPNTIQDLECGNATISQIGRLTLYGSTVISRCN